jgi:nucleotide-binding universal stress UspA family protein
MVIRKVVVAVDWSPVSKRAVELAAEIARAANAGMTLVHVRDPSSRPPEKASSPTGSPRTDSLEAVAATWSDEVRRSGVADVKTVLLDGPPVDALLGYVEANPPDLLVFGRRGHSSGTRMLLGGITSSVLQHAQCPVLVVP